MRAAKGPRHLRPLCGQLELFTIEVAWEGELSKVDRPLKLEVVLIPHELNGLPFAP